MLRFEVHPEALGSGVPETEARPLPLASVEQQRVSALEREVRAL
jgi:hypothetical protein